MLFKKAIHDCNDNTKCVSTLVKFMETCYWASYMIDNIKGIFGIHGCSRSESNHSSAKNFFTEFGRYSWCYAIIDESSTQINVTK